MSLPLLFSVCVLVFGIHDSRSELRFTDPILFDLYRGHKLNLPNCAKTQSTKAKNMMGCLSNCVAVDWCKSVNLNTKPGEDGLRLCELLSSDRLKNLDGLKKNETYEYLNFKTPCDIFNGKPCIHGGECTLRDGNYTCCDGPLGMSDGRIPDQNISASSSNTDPKCQPQNGRLNKGNNRAWCAEPNFRLGKEYLEIDLEVVTKVTKGATQGRSTYSQWVTKYSLSYSNDGTSWNQYNDCTKLHSIKIFSGNINEEGVVTNDLPIPITARYIRIIPLGYHGYMSMRLELYGC